ncbi:hypothetical protein [Legionella sp.]|uniref:hypothetical protein n=1 Tax=Legionella sp. TaxID=459 RepID=UPI003CAF167F
MKNYNYDALFEFVYELINTQIEKYVNLVKIGIGPDASINANLVLDEVTELMDSAKNLLMHIEKPPHTHEEFVIILEQVRFYLEQEQLRGTASYLLDENKVHSGQIDWMNKQFGVFSEFSAAADIDMSRPALAITESQKQCEHDSNAIAFYILDIAKKLKSDPKIEFEQSFPKHAAIILRRNASPEINRYNQPNISQKIDELHARTNTFLKQSNLKKRDDLFCIADLNKKQLTHQELLTQLLSRYQLVKPNSKLFSQEDQDHQISSTQSKSILNSVLSKRGFFSTVAVIGIPISLVLINYLKQKQEDPMQRAQLN